MMDVGRIARLGVLAAGLGIGAAMASIPGIASADSSDWLSTVDGLLSGIAAPAADSSSGLNIAISMDGVTLLQEGTAHAYSGANGDIAMATGAGDTAIAYGTNNYADVLGTNSIGVAGGTSAESATGSNDDTVFIDGNNDYGFAGGSDGNPGTFDYAVIFGNNDQAYSGGDAAGAGSYDGAYVEGNDLGTAHAQGADYLADILKFYGDGASSAAAAAADATTPAAESGNLLSDLVGLFDPATAAADSTNLLSELASLF